MRQTISLKPPEDFLYLPSDCVSRSPALTWGNCRPSCCAGSNGVSRSSSFWSLLPWRHTHTCTEIDFKSIWLFSNLLEEIQRKATRCLTKGQDHAPQPEVQAGQLCSGELNDQSGHDASLQTSLAHICKQQRMGRKNGDTKLSITFFFPQSLCRG